MKKMKKIYLSLVCLLILLSCKEDQKKYVLFSGKILNQYSDSLIVTAYSSDFSKLIFLDQNGVFQDTLKITENDYYQFNLGEYTTTYLKKGDDLNLTLDTKQFDETIKYSGRGSDIGNFLAKIYLIKEQFYSNPSVFEMTKDSFDYQIASLENAFNSELSRITNIDSIFKSEELGKFNDLKTSLLNTHAQTHFLKSMKGSASPKFVAYENYSGGTTSLDDFKGKYVYIDIWATWCGPCIYQLPDLKKLEADYSNKNIVFISISIDNGRGFKNKSLQEAKLGWRQMIEDKEMGGVQLFSDSAWESEFIKDYKIDGIPRFILIDPKGNIVSADAPRPSDEKLKELFDELNIE